ncbi:MULTISPECIES: methyltransferase domain-containing protein [unclassified Synechococcus]|uniref:methyltransferase domain-containing protein n=1 Tax=unclassified Synechococcus TaxID=2626047 RepID=UPI0020CC4975|nr:MULTISPECIES: methyltransferase domain-containing protein [unclassified Synechococcus]
MIDRAPAYSSYTYAHPNWLVSYPHIKRNKLIAQEIIAIGASEWCDYGAGDGGLLLIPELAKRLPRSVVLYEPDEQMHNELVRNIACLTEPSANITLTRSPMSVSGTFSLITACEVLEHLPLPERIRFYQFLAAHLKDDGIALIEVPVEFGPILLAKEWGRKFLKGRASHYGVKELIAAATIGRITDKHCRYQITDSRTFISPHHGFDINRLIAEMKSIGMVQELFRSPFPLLPRWLNQAVLFSFRLTERSPSMIQEAVHVMSGGKS